MRGSKDAADAGLVDTAIREVAEETGIRIGSADVPLSRLVDWQLLVMFIGLFVVNHAFERTGLVDAALRAFAGAGVPLGAPAPLFAATLIAIRATTPSRKRV